MSFSLSLSGHPGNPNVSLSAWYAPEGGPGDSTSFFGTVEEMDAVALKGTAWIKDHLAREAAAEDAASALRAPTEEAVTEEEAAEDEAEVPEIEDA